MNGRLLALSREWRGLLGFFLMCNMANNLAAAGDLSEKDYLQEFPVVLSASRLSQPLSEAPNAVTVIDRAMIQASGFRTIADLFRLVPGMYVGYLDGHSPVVAYHGATDQYSRRMQVLVDGRSVYLPPFSTVDWEDIPLQIDDIERIEVIRGSAAASHGANSLQGVINITTRDAASVRGASVAVVKGGGGVSEVSAHLGKTGADMDVRATFGYRADHGFGTAVLNDGNATRLANLRANYHPMGADSFDFQLGYNEGVRGLGVTGKSDNPFRDARVASNFQQISWMHTQSSSDELKLHYYHIYRNYQDAGGVTAFQDNTVVDRHELELQYTTQLNASNRLVWGAGARADAVESPLNLALPQSLRQSRWFAHDEWRMSPSALLNVGAMYENDGMGHGNTSPRISFNYHLAPQHTLRVSSSVAYRTPATVEEHGYTAGYFLATGGLRPEKSRSKEIGYLGEFDTLGATLDARIYSDELSDVIYLDPLMHIPDGHPYSFANLLSTSYRGMESTIKYRWGERGNLIFNFARQMASCSVTGTLTHPVLLPLLQGVADACSAMVPWNSGSILLTRQIRDDLQFSAGYYYQESLTMIKTEPQSRMRRLDFRVAKVIGRAGKVAGGEVALVLQNAFQDNYTGYAAVPQLDNIMLFNRRAYLTATVNF